MKPAEWHLRIRRYFLVALLAAIVVATFQLATRIGVVPGVGQICNEGAHGAAEQCANHHIALVIAWELAKFLDKAAGALTAVATIILAVFTWRLWWSTNKLWEEAKAASAISKQSADAAKASADAAVKAEMPILFLLIVDASDLLPANTVYVNQHVPRLTFVFENYGASPAILISARFELLLEPQMPASPPWTHPEPFTDREVIPGNTRYNPDPKTIQKHFTFTLSREITRDEIAAARRKTATPEEPETRRFFFYGEVVYDDVFGYRHIRGYGRKVFPAASGKIPLQPIRGGDAYDYYKRVDRATGQEG